MTNDERQTIIRDALQTYGMDSQASMIIEECAEAISATNQFLRGRITPAEWAAEIADVEITTSILRAEYGDEFIDTQKDIKLNRLKDRIEQMKKQTKEPA